MATFIPEWNRASGREVHVRRVLAALGDEHVIRRPLRAGAALADLFVQHPVRGWLAMAVCGDAFDVLDPTQLFSSRQRGELESRLEGLQSLGREPGSQGHGMSVLVIMWACSTDEVRHLTREYLIRYGVRLVSRERFCALGAKLVDGLLQPLPDESADHLLAQQFPEAEIPAYCAAQATTPSNFPRDNAARLARHFLDPQQEWTAKLDLDVPREQREAAADFSVRLLNGVAGSGKTVIAVQRALLLAELFPRQRILLIIHNTPIVADLKERLHRSGRPCPPRVEILTFFAWLHHQWKRAFKSVPRMLEDPGQVLDLVSHHRRRWPELKLSGAELADELAFIDDNLFTDEAAYLAASRAGRGFALRAADRGRVWALHRAVSDSLRRSGRWAWSALPRALGLAEDRHSALRRYDHILVDEAQFFAPSWFRIVKLSLAPGGQLFLCADPNQGFMRNRLSWKSAGLDVAGRTKKLRRSYRTTRALLRAATTVLSTLETADADDYLAPDLEAMEEGTPPLLAYAASPQDAVERVANEVGELAVRGAIPLDAFLVLHGDNVNRDALHAALARRFGAGSVWWFNERTQKKEPPRGRGHDYLRMASVDTATGLEADIVFLVGMESLFLLASGDGLDASSSSHREDGARKLYMAMTRARRTLVVVSSRRLSAEMERLFDEPDGRQWPA
jgi:hypothetical protein